MPNEKGRIILDWTLDSIGWDCKRNGTKKMSKRLRQKEIWRDQLAMKYLMAGAKQKKRERKMDRERESEIESKIFLFDFHFRKDIFARFQILFWNRETNKQYQLASLEFAIKRKIKTLYEFIE